MTTHLLYLHGFRSSPLSTKAQQMARWMAAHRPDVHWWCPQLPPSPREAMALIEAGCADWPTAGSAVIGSSLGGFYATALANRHGWRAVLLNPAIFPERDLARHIGEQSHWQDPQQRFYFRPEFIQELEELQPGAPLWPERCCAIIAKGDEVLDWCEMHARFASSCHKLLERGDHALSDFELHLAQILQFLHLSPTDHQHPSPPCV